MKYLYKCGLVIGSFNPPHFGHINLIECALEMCERVIVQVGMSSVDVIKPFDLKEYLIRTNLNPRLLSRQQNLIFYEFDDELYIQQARSYDNVVKSEEYWTSWIERTKESFSTLGDFPDVIVSSEKYAIRISEELKIDFVEYDRWRVLAGISSSTCRSLMDTDLILNGVSSNVWNRLLPQIRERFAKLIIINGVEGSGKSTLVEGIRDNYTSGVNIVHEYGRTYCENLAEKQGIQTKDVILTLKDFKNIVIVHDTQLSRAARHSNTGLVVSDTDALTTSIFSTFLLPPEEALEFQNWVKPFIEKQLANVDIYILTSPAFYYDHDGSRVLTNEQRELFYQILTETLSEYNIPFQTLSAGSTTNVLGQAFIAMKSIPRKGGISKKLGVPSEW